MFENNLRTFEEKVNKNIPMIIERQKFNKGMIYDSNIQINGNIYVLSKYFYFYQYIYIF